MAVPAASHGSISGLLLSNRSSSSSSSSLSVAAAAARGRQRQQRRRPADATAVTTPTSSSCADAATPAPPLPTPSGSSNLPASTPAAALPHGLRPEQLPRHVAIIMDGNARWAAARGLPPMAGHERGVAALRSVVEAAVEWRLAALTVFSFSLENFARGADEVAFLMGLFERSLEGELRGLQANNVRLCFAGDVARLPRGLQRRVAACEAATAANTGLVLTVCCGYSGQHDVAAAARALARRVQRGELEPDDITPDLLGQELSTARAVAAAGPPDLLLRTSGEQRLSGFLLFECAYAEVVFVREPWPGFGRRHLGDALAEYAARARRYGRRGGGGGGGGGGGKHEAAAAAAREAEAEARRTGTGG